MQKTRKGRIQNNQGVMGSWPETRTGVWEIVVANKGKEGMLLRIEARGRGNVVVEVASRVGAKKPTVKSI